jgi:hypothetical protein
MTLIGYAMMCEQADPKQLARDVALAGENGFDPPLSPAVVAQKAATMQLLPDGRFTLGLGDAPLAASRHNDRMAAGG